MRVLTCSHLLISRDGRRKISYFDNWHSKIVLAKCITSAQLNPDLTATAMTSMMSLSKDEFVAFLNVIDNYDPTADYPFFVIYEGGDDKKPTRLVLEEAEGEIGDRKWRSNVLKRKRASANDKEKIPVMVDPQPVDSFVWPRVRTWEDDFEKFFVKENDNWDAMKMLLRNFFSAIEIDFNEDQVTLVNVKRKSNPGKKAP